jgi:hypothetical protein
MPKKKSETIQVSDNLYTVAVCAVRYALGRRTYMPGLVTDWLMANFTGRMPRGTAEIMLRDIQEQREMGERARCDSLGDPCDVRTWEKFEAWLKEEIGKCTSTDTEP